MKLQVVSATAAGVLPAQPWISYVVDDHIALDTGALPGGLPLVQQRAIKHVFLSHSHLDHTGGLPLFLDDVFTPGQPGPIVYGLPETLDSLQRDLFNNRVWPDFIALSCDECSFLRLAPLQSDVPVQIGTLRVTPLTIPHVVPTVAFLIEQGEVAVAVISDTHQPEVLWPRLLALPTLRAVYLECSFPDALAELAVTTQHLTPQRFLQAVQVLPSTVEIRAIHLKLNWQTEIVQQLQRGNPRIQPAIPGQAELW